MLNLYYCILSQDVIPLPQLKEYGESVGKDINFKGNTDPSFNSLRQKATYLESNYSKILCQTESTASN